ncbi:DNA-directed RNA polymerase subunit beta' [Candidatus Wolfebacteria bacterium]|nr:DNA-directed RNA polymerase subunit beta' [Candidatus Wolfebacteria bacterium]
MEFGALKIKIASPDEMLSWSHGEVTKPETINYRSQRPEKDGLFSEKIFGPTKDYECYCGKYRRIRYKGVVCDKCGVEVTRSIVRRERMGHVMLATPIAHIWFLRTVPSKIGLFLDVPPQKLEKVIYYAAYIVTAVKEEARRQAIFEVRKELKSRGAKGASPDLEEAARKAEEDLASLRPGKVFSEAEYVGQAKRFAHVFEAGRGAEAVRKILEKIDLKKEVAAVEAELKSVKDATREHRLLYRLKLLRSFLKNNMRPEWMIMTVLPVLPPDLRPMVALDGGRYATSDLNDLYRRVINRNNRLKKLVELKAPEVIVTNEKRMLQEAVDALIDNSTRLGSSPQLSAQHRPLRSLADMLRGKQGRFRQNLLGKRVDYSGRSVIVVGPELRLNECGLPKKMALELFKPFVIHKLIAAGQAHNIRSANRLIEQATPEIWAALEEVIANRKVLLNRAPTLHRLGIQAFRPVLIEDLAIRIPPMVCTAFNADFDGDQMAVHVPLTDEAQREASEIMLSSNNLLKPSTGEPIIIPSQDIVLGSYVLTKGEKEKESQKFFASENEALLALFFSVIGINETIRVSRDGIRNFPDDKKDDAFFVRTTAGRVLFNSVLPADFPFVNRPLRKKDLQRIVAELIERYGGEAAWPILDEIKRLGFRHATLSGISWGMEDLMTPPVKQKILAAAEAKIQEINAQCSDGLLTAAERRSRVIDVWETTKAEITKIMPSHLDENGPIFSIIDSGARGSWSQLIQMAGMKGLVQNPKGETIELPIKASYKEGLSASEFFINTHSARKGLIDTALKTASAGYLTRRLVDVAQDVVIREHDCRTTEGIEVYRADGDEFGYHFADRLYGRVAVGDIKVGRRIVAHAGRIINREIAEAIEKSSIASVNLRSPISCKSIHGMCSTCYGLDLGRNQPIAIGEAVGIVAAQSIGEPGTQLTLRTFHTGGIAGVDITHGLPRVQELFEVRAPKGKALLSDVDGVVLGIEERGATRALRIKTHREKGKKARVVEYSLPAATMILVRALSAVTKGDQLSEGSVDLKELYAYKGRNAVERYLINEIQKVYVPEGTAINDKHVEIILRQMFARVMVKDQGETELVIGEVIEKPRFLEMNREARRRGKQPARAKQLLTGITKTALSAESFLSSASFQETARVLVRAASEGRVDLLRGLKENVIIGRLIPVGTGYESNPPPTEKDGEE